MAVECWDKFQHVQWEQSEYWAVQCCPCPSVGTDAGISVGWRDRVELGCGWGTWTRDQFESILNSVASRSLFFVWIENGHYCEIRKKAVRSGFLLIWYRLKIFLIYVEKFIYKFSFRSKSHDIKTKCCVTRFTPWNLNRAIYLRWLIPACDTCHVSPPTIKINNTLHNKPRS